METELGATEEEPKKVQEKEKPKLEQLRRNGNKPEENEKRPRRNENTS